MSLRLRQIVFAAGDLQRTVTQFESTLDLPVVHRDPQVAAFGLENALLMIGDQFIEVVAPTRVDAAAARHLVRHGDSAYMLILQTDDLARDRQRLNRLGVRIVWESTHADMSSVQLHPKDIGAAIVSLDQSVPSRSWRWAGPDWQQCSAIDSTQRIREVTLGARNPAAMAQRWAEVLGTDAPRHEHDKWQIAIAEGALSFVQSSDDTDRILEYLIEAQTQRATQTICGTRFRWVCR